MEYVTQEKTEEKKKNFLKSWKFWLILIGGVVLIQIMGALARQNLREELSNPKSNESEMVVFEGSEKEEYITTCTSEGVQRKLCECIIRKMDGTFTMGELVSIFAQQKLNKQPEETREILNSCKEETVLE